MTPSIYLFKKNNKSYAAISTNYDIGKGSTSKVNEMVLFKIKINNTDNQIEVVSNIGQCALKTRDSEDIEDIDTAKDESMRTTKCYKALGGKLMKLLVI